MARGSLPGGRERVAAGRPACQRATRVLRDAPALRVTRRPPRGSDGNCGPCGPAWTERPGLPRRSRGRRGPPDSRARRTGATVPGGAVGIDHGIVVVDLHTPFLRGSVFSVARGSVLSVACSWWSPIPGAGLDSRRGDCRLQRRKRGRRAWSAWAVVVGRLAMNVRQGGSASQGQRSPRLNVIASKGGTQTGSASFAVAVSTHRPSRSSNASKVWSDGSTSHRCPTPSRA